MNDFWNGIVSIAIAIVGVATLAVLVSKNANTGNILTSAGTAFSGALTAAEGPVLGGGLGNESIGPGYYG